MTDQEILDKLVKEKMENECEPYEFDGWNCHDLDDNDCGGWDGYNRRCNCSNRRVCWVLSDCKTYVYAEAY